MSRMKRRCRNTPGFESDEGGEVGEASVAPGDGGEQGQLLEREEGDGRQRVLHQLD